VRLKDLGEFGLIQKFFRSAGTRDRSVLAGIGDDAAVIALGSDHCLLVTTDILLEDIHFTQRFTTPFLLGKKSVAVNLSDIAAMGGDPRYYVVSLSVPGSLPVRFVQELYRGMRSRARQWGVVLLGGDTTGSKHGVSLSITMIGTAARSRVVYRHGARPGDQIYVTGTLGNAALGLTLLMRGLDGPESRQLIRRHQDPEPRVAVGRMLGAQKIATSMIDISDGLLGDLHHILEQSQVGARLVRDAIPLSRQYKKFCQYAGSDPYRCALAGGEDYELLFTAPAHHHARIHRIAQSLKLPITPIGEIIKRPGWLEVVDKHGRRVPVGREKGFTHF